jgi:hypothetical protein
LLFHTVRYSGELEPPVSMSVTRATLTLARAMGVVVTDGVADRVGDAVGDAVGVVGVCIDEADVEDEGLLDGVRDGEVDPLGVGEGDTAVDGVGAPVGVEEADGDGVATTGDDADGEDEGDGDGEGANDASSFPSTDARLPSPPSPLFLRLKMPTSSPTPNSAATTTPSTTGRRFAPHKPSDRHRRPSRRRSGPPSPPSPLGARIGLRVADQSSGGAAGAVLHTIDPSRDFRVVRQPCLGAPQPPQHPPKLAQLPNPFAYSRSISITVLVVVPCESEQRTSVKALSKPP